ncbi:cytochrome P450, partial [Backusella circina FSU 941]
LMDFFSRLDRDRAISIISIAAATSLVFSSLYLISDRNKTREGYKEIPVPRASYPYVGHLLSLGKYPGRALAKWHKENGPIIKLKMGIQNWISIDDPKLAQELFAHNGTHSSSRPLTNFGLHYSYNQRGVSFANGERWKAARGALLSVLAPKQVDKYLDKIEFEASELIERLVLATGMDGSVDPASDLQMLSLNVISHVTVGKRYNSKEDPEFKSICAMIKNLIKHGAFEKDLPQFLPALSFLTTVSNVEESFIDFVKNERDPIIKKLIDEATVTSEINIMKILDSESFHITPIEKLVLLCDIIAAGADTTETALYWAIAIMCNYPDVQKKIQLEIDGFVKENGTLPRFGQRDQVPYTVSVLKECMRYRPITSFGLPHATSQDIDLKGYLIPKGTVVLTCMKSMHGDLKIYDEPEKFIPERFLQNTKSMYASANGNVSDRDHFNFGWGRRLCPGIYLAEVEMFNSYISLFSKCTIEPVTDASSCSTYPDIIDEKNAGVIVAPIPYRVRVIRR